MGEDKKSFRKLSAFLIFLGMVFLGLIIWGAFFGYHKRQITLKYGNRTYVFSSTSPKFTMKKAGTEGTHFSILHIGYVHEDDSWEAEVDEVPSIELRGYGYSEFSRTYIVDAGTITDAEIAISLNDVLKVTLKGDTVILNDNEASPIKVAEKATYTVNVDDYDRRR